VDVERTIQSIVEAQARNGAQIGMLAANDARLGRRIDGVTKILKIGMRQLVKLGDAQKRTEATVKSLAVKGDQSFEAQKDLAKAQKNTELTLRAFIDSMSKGGNGKGRNGR
jgi:hypothetical protein